MQAGDEKIRRRLMREEQAAQAETARRKAQLASEESKRAAEFAQFRANMVLLWTTTNVSLVVLVLYLGFLSGLARALPYIVAITIGMRVFGA